MNVAVLDTSVDKVLYLQFVYNSLLWITASSFNLSLKFAIFFSNISKSISFPSTSPSTINIHPSPRYFAFKRKGVVILLKKQLQKKLKTTFKTAASWQIWLFETAQQPWFQVCLAFQCVAYMEYGQTWCYFDILLRKIYEPNKHTFLLMWNKFVQICAILELKFLFLFLVTLFR